MWVKICGNTNLEDATLAAELGADAVGFVFATSKRQVTSAQVAAITPHLPEGLERVGVFAVNAPDEIAQVALASGLTTVQLHGVLDEELLKRLTDRLAGRVHVIQTLHWAVDGQVSGDAAADEFTQHMEQISRLGIVSRVLVDSQVGSSSGGTGIAFDWSQARDVFAAVPDGIHLILAGGLRLENVGQAIEQLEPWGVDVCSGVEASPGRKSPERLARFVKSARTAISRRE